MDAALVEETFRVTLTLRARPEELSCPLFDQVRNAGDWLQESWWGGAEPAEVVRWQVERASAPAPAPAPGAALVGEGAVVHVHVAAEDAAPMRLLLAQAGRAVWNAPRPLDGLVRWTGPFRQGLFYAAGPATRFAARNAELGAARVELVDDTRLLALLDQRLAADGYSRADLAGEGLSVREACAHYHLPEPPAPGRAPS